MIDVCFRHQAGALNMDVDIQADHGVTAIFGRSGCGKTTLINVLAGLIRPASGRVAVDDRVFLDTDRDIFLKPEHRRTGYVFQDTRLFPHMTVKKNLVYGLQTGRGHKQAVAFEEVVSLLALSPLLQRHSGLLSGGEKQRVAIGRALLSSPALLLLDEPLASLDRAHKQEILPYIQKLCREYSLPTFYVSHAMDEVVQMADTVVTMADGKTVDHRPVEGVFGHGEGTAYDRETEPCAVINARVQSHDDTHHLSTLTCSAGVLTIPGCAREVNAPVRVRIQARDVAVATLPPRETSILNILEGVLGATYNVRNTAQIDLVIDLGGTEIMARITRQSFSSLGLYPGMRIYAMVKATAIE